MATGRLIDRNKFFPLVRQSIFDGQIIQSKIDGMNHILDTWDTSVFTDLRWLAYMLGTAYHETAATMQPIKEYGGYDYFERMYGPNGSRGATARKMGNIHSGDGAKYCGRGYVQLTWEINYLRAGRTVGIDLVSNPDLAMRPDIAAKIMFEGMTNAAIIFEDHTSADPAFSFTGRTLENYFNTSTEDWIGARRIINGTDHAAMIAATAKEFYAALAYQAGAAAEPQEPPPPPAAGPITRTLRLGMTGEDVKLLQVALNIMADGYFGPAETEPAVKAFQASHGLKADGVAGPITLRAMGLN